MERIDRSNDLVEFLSAGGGSADATIDKTFAKIRFWSIAVKEKFIFDIAFEKVGVATGPILIPIATLLIVLQELSPNEKQLSVRISSARRSKVAELGFSAGR